MTFPKWHEEVDENGSDRDVKPFPSRTTARAVLAILAVASCLTFVSILWQHISSSTAAVMGHSLTYGTVKGHVGSAAMILGWGGVSLGLVSTMGILIMILSIWVLRESL